MRGRGVVLLLAAAAVALLVLLVVAGLPDDGADAPDPVLGDPGEDVPSALDDPRHPALPEPLIDLDELISGGPPPDGIPPIDHPRFEPASAVTWLVDTDPVLSLTVGEETRAYPLAIMTWHEIVNDVVDDTPVAVTYCPLCNSGVAFHREVGDRLLDFGTSGLLYVDNLVMYDRQTESLWPQLTGRAAVGHLTGTRLASIPIGVVGWEQFRSAHPDARVLTRDTGHDRDYGRNPYAGYDEPDGALVFRSRDDVDPRLPVKERVIGIRVGDDALAVRREHVARSGVVEVTVGGRELVVWHAEGQASALDSAEIRAGREVGSVGVFVPEAADRDLTFTRRAGTVVDDQTGSEWTVLGQATAGPLEGESLTEQRHLDTFWFAWVGFQPDTRLSP